MSETEARHACRNVKVGRRDMSQTGKARELGKDRGFIKVVLDAPTNEIVGAAALCERGSDVVRLFVELMNAGTSARVMLEAVHIHPTIAETAKNAVVAAIGA